MKKRIITFVLLVLLTVLPFASVFGVFAATGGQYKDTYYAGLSKQYDRLRAVNEPKVIVVGGSNVAFGLDSELFEQLYGKPSVCFGLYGSLGVKVMMDLSKANINKGDTVVLVPETSPEGYSTYFGAESVLKATEGRLDILSHIAFDNIGDVLAASWGFATTKIGNDKRAEDFDLDGVYQNKNINAYGEIDKTVFPREGNVLATGYLQERISLDPTDVSKDFVEFVNDYVDYCTFRGATVYFSFSPMNERAVDKTDLRGTADEYYRYLSDNLKCQVISDPCDYIYDYRYFYDTNFHLNDAGVVLRTAQLVRDLKLAEGDASKTDVQLPAPPAPIYKQKEIDLTLDYADDELFEYIEEDGVLKLCGVKESARETVNGMAELVLPVVHDNKYVVSIVAGALKDMDGLVNVTVPVGYTEIDNNVFEGCSSLKSIRILENDPDSIAVFDDLLYGTNSNCKIYLVNSSASAFGAGYFWRRYADNLVTGDMK